MPKPSQSIALSTSPLLRNSSRPKFSTASEPSSIAPPSSPRYNSSNKTPPSMSTSGLAQSASSRRRAVADIAQGGSEAACAPHFAEGWWNAGLGGERCDKCYKRAREDPVEDQEEALVRIRKSLW
ncbi:hypothetical protein OIDMADRAFT_16044 [Oidiodendron maius Zn]|uniref:Uncharacterized protein n=1 Tax=Oidiodendron maius (strain Zn) TaxID=913774 RepID=A0A0C3DYT4_OIDMZ|nr:hypothetical protein OIDMADRAFT_16044 [Oidiodendron maius Zn]